MEEENKELEQEIQEIWKKMANLSLEVASIKADIKLLFEKVLEDEPD
ncbi:MAG: hypothetical protein PWQ59_2374 [Thermoanaerobacterium sp.]|jgi:uncharacterized protein (UPF0335 family)|nr:hypothetical protein [Thermoanaerobacterium sp.]